MARSATGQKQVANGKQGGGTPTGRAAQARAAAKKTTKPSTGSSANAVQRMGLGSIYDKIVAEPTSSGGSTGNTSTPGVASTKRVGGSGSARGYAGAGGGSYDAAAAAAAQAAAYRQGIVNQYVTPTNKLYDTATNAVGQDFAPTEAAYVGATADADADASAKIADTNITQERRLADRFAYMKNAGVAQIAPDSGGASMAQSNANQKTRNGYDQTIANSYAKMYGIQTNNAGGRIQSVIDAMNDERKRQLAAIAQTYGITL
jgi:hypothetical protein